MNCLQNIGIIEWIMILSRKRYDWFFVRFLMRVNFFSDSFCPSFCHLTLFLSIGLFGLVLPTLVSWVFLLIFKNDFRWFCWFYFIFYVTINYFFYSNIFLVFHMFYCFFRVLDDASSCVDCVLRKIILIKSLDYI